MSYQDERRAFIQAGRPLLEKKKYFLNKVSVKRQKKLDEQKVARDSGEETLKEKWFAAVRKKLVGTCQCGCGKPSQKKDDTFFRNSCCHIFPKKKFESVMYHPLNFVERAFFGGCHTNMDDRSISLWPQFADWDDIREKFFILAPLLTDEERSKKFYSHLEKLVYAK